VNVTFSIVTAVINSEDLISKTLRSVSEQVCPEFEIEHILVEGVSKDNTLNLIKSWVEKSTSSVSYSVVSETDRGLYDAMNKGRGIASGDFIFFLNAGDVFSSTNLLKQVYENIRFANKLDAVYYGNIVIRSALKIWTVPSGNVAIGPHRIGNAKGYLPHHQSIFYPRSFYQSQEIDIEYIIHGDVEYTLLSCRQFDCYHMPIEITQIELGGFGTKAFTVKAAYNAYRDYVKLVKKHPESFPYYAQLLAPFKYLFKYLVDTFLGTKYKHFLMGSMVSIRKLLNTYTKNCLYTE
jgi:glycosyltransferase involved in cell wall biosynthesis